MKRRDFIKNTAPVAVIPFISKGISIAAYAESSFMNAMIRPDITSDKVLVIIQMNGGNDGLNTVIPLDQYTNLAAARASVLIPAANVLALNGVTNVGLHPSMTAMRNLFNNNKLAIVQGVGYPDPDFSHFRATDIWNTASDSNESLTSGWAGRYLANEYPNFPQGYPNTTMPDPLAIQIGAVLSTVFQGLSQNVAQTVPLPDSNGAISLTQLATGTTDPVPNTPAGTELTYLRAMMVQANAYATVIQSAWNAGGNGATYPNPPSGTGYRASNLAQQLKTVARLIKGGLKTRVYMVNMGSFDTHADQVDVADHKTGEHAFLLQELSDAIGAFQEDLNLMALEDRVLGMTYSEFGRRIVSNASSGTDHGAAAPMFLFGTKVQHGILGSNPTIAPNLIGNENVPMQYDFRSIYTTILQEWFCLPQTTADSVLLHSKPLIPILNSTCTPVSTTHQRAGDAYIRNYPNPAAVQTTIQLEAFGQNVVVEIFDPQGRLIDTLIDAMLPNGVHEITYDVSHLPQGNYYYRYQSGTIVQTKALTVVR